MSSDSRQQKWLISSFFSDTMSKKKKKGKLFSQRYQTVQTSSTTSWLKSDCWCFSAPSRQFDPVKINICILCFFFHANRITAASAFLFSSKVPTKKLQSDERKKKRQTRVAENWKMSRFLFNRSLFLRLSSVQICTPTVCFSIFIFANFLQ